jgi:aquaporin Z
MFRALRKHWPEYLMEAAGLALFMMSAGFFGTMLEDPVSSAHQALTSPFLRRALMGLAMGLTAVVLIYSPLGKCSGAHLNPAVTLTFLRLRKVPIADGCAYVLAQFLGGVFGAYMICALYECRFL